MPHISSFRLLSAALALALVAGCSSFAADTQIDYKSASSAAVLEIPPDLTQLGTQGRYAAAASTSARVYETQQAREAQARPTALDAAGDVRIQRDGNQRWLVVARPAAQLWEPLKAFWEDSGFVLSSQDQRTGVMETDWAENRAKLPQDIIRKTLGKLFDTLYSTGEMDRFRTRLERSPDGQGAYIFISHRGMEEVYSSNDKTQTRWQPRANDPGLEDEMLLRLMVALGVPQERAQALMQQEGQRAAAQQVGVQYDAQNQSLHLADDVERAWRRVGLALDRTGFTVEDRDRAAGIYYVRYVPLVPEKQQPTGFFAKMFKKKTAPSAVKYRVRIQGAAAGGTQVQVLGENGQSAANADAQRILQLIANDLRQL